MAVISMRITIVSWVFLLVMPAVVVGSDGEDTPTPAPWPERFHAQLYMNLSDGRLQISDLWYDWPAGRNVNLMQKQLGVLLHDVEWDNGTSFYYTLGPTGHCRTMLFPVGIPRRDFMVGSTYLGPRYTDGFLCHLWEKVDFIWYYEDAATRRPVRWDFYDG
ncbi:uncharacterized protein At4g14100 isoform X2 [Elaeis guineensis]